MKIAEVSQRVMDWVHIQRHEFDAEELAKATGLSQRSASIYLSRLERRGVIKRRKKGRYGLFHPTPSRSVQRLANILLKELPLTKLVIWSTDAVVQYLHYFPNRHLIFVETEKENVSSLRDVLLEKGFRVKARPSRKDLLESYSDGLEVLVFAKKDRYGTRPWKGEMSTASLERVLVDLYVLASRKGLSFPTEEVIGALESALGENAVCRDSLRKYSKRRYVYRDLSEWIEGKR